MEAHSPASMASFSLLVFVNIAEFEGVTYLQYPNKETGNAELLRFEQWIQNALPMWLNRELIEFII